MPTSCPMSLFMSDYDTEKSIESVRVAMNEFCQQFGFDYITYFALDAPMFEGGTLLLTTYPETWKAHYFEHQYEKIDPVLSNARMRLTPLDWCELPPLNGAAENFFSDSRRFGLGRQGMTVPVRGQFGELVLLSVNADISSSAWSRRWQGSMADYTYFAYLLHLRILHILGADTRTSPRLSRQEAEVMRWAVRGKSAWETAQLTGLTERTVQFYIRNVCAKLEVATKTQAVARVVREHLIPL